MTPLNDKIFGKHKHCDETSMKDRLTWHKQSCDGALVEVPLVRIVEYVASINITAKESSDGES